MFTSQRNNFSARPGERTLKILVKVQDYLERQDMRYHADWEMNNFDVFKCAESNEANTIWHLPSTSRSFSLL